MTCARNSGRYEVEEQLANGASEGAELKPVDDEQEGAPHRAAPAVLLAEGAALLIELPAARRLPYSPWAWLAPVPLPPG